MSSDLKIIFFKENWMRAPIVYSGGSGFIISETLSCIDLYPY
jgi:hypothetical protein